MATTRAVAPDDDVVIAAQACSPVAFAELYALHSRRLYRTIFAITKNPEDADEALQETFLRAHLALHTFEGRSTIHTWMARIAINSALMTLRKRRARPEMLSNTRPDDGAEIVLFDVKDSAPNPEQVYGLRQRQLTLLRAIGRLQPQLRAPLRMQMMHGSSVREIDLALNLSVAAVKARLYRARLQLSKSAPRQSAPHSVPSQGSTTGTLWHRWNHSQGR
jgi:RNA polymerase sigma-70 factor, ECF subfamily